jgi:hypothetical protein
MGYISEFDFQRVRILRTLICGFFSLEGRNCANPHDLDDERPDLPKSRSCGSSASTQKRVTAVECDPATQKCRSKILHGVAQPGRNVTAHGTAMRTRSKLVRPSPKGARRSVRDACLCAHRRRERASPLQGPDYQMRGSQLACAVRSASKRVWRSESGVRGPESKTPSSLSSGNPSEVDRAARLPEISTVQLRREFLRTPRVAA